MRQRLLAFATTSLLVLNCGFAQGEEDPEKQAAQLIAKLTTTPVEQLSTITGQLVMLGEEVVAVLQDGLKSDDTTIRYGCARALMEMGEDDGAGVQVVVDIVRDGKDDTLRALCCDLLVDEGATDAGAALTALLSKPMPGTLRARLARAVYFLDRDNRIKARAAMQALMASWLEDSKVAGALALADIGQIDVARSVLEELALESTMRGRVAALHLKVDEWKRLALQGVTDRGRETGNAVDSRLDLVQELMHMVKELHHDGDRHTRDDLIDAAARGLIQSLDPHSTFLSAKEVADWQFDLNPTYGGIGAYVNLDQDNRIFIVRPIYSGPAYSHELLSGDKIIRVDGWDTMGSPIKNITKRL